MMNAVPRKFLFSSELTSALNIYVHVLCTFLCVLLTTEDKAKKIH